jgi:ABC-type sugar transport system substrate-binding protein
MKKVISVLLALIFVFALFACSDKNAGSSPSVAPSVAPSAAPSVAPSSAAPSTAPSAEPSAAAPSDAAPVDLTKSADEVGFFKSGVDPNSRKTYNIVHMYPFTLLLFEKMTECFNHYGTTLNCKVTPSTTENDMDKFVQQIQTFADQGDVDGFMMVIDPPTKDRILEVLDETTIPYMVWCNSMRDDTGSEITPCVGLEQKQASAITVQWLFDNYKTYWGDIDTSQIALLNIDTSLSVDLRDRGIGAEEKFNELIPNNAGIFYIDMLTDFSQDFSFNQSSATFSAHPEIKYWFSTNCVEMNSQGVARAVETLGIEDKVLITDVGSDILCSEWDTGYNGSWKSCLAISNYLYAAPALCGLVALLDGTATWDTLWTDMRAPGDKYTFYGAASSMVTKDTYKEYFNGYAELAGAPIPYAS